MGTNFCLKRPVPNDPLLHAEAIENQMKRHLENPFPPDQREEHFEKLSFPVWETSFTKKISKLDLYFFSGKKYGLLHLKTYLMSTKKYNLLFSFQDLLKYSTTPKKTMKL